MEEKYTIKLGNDPAKVLLKHMRETLKQLKPSCSEKQCNDWEELIKKVEAMASDKSNT